MRRILVVVYSILLCVGCAYTQSALPPGILPFSTQAHGPITSIDLATSNIIMAVPVRNKIGKIPFSFSLVMSDSPWGDGIIGYPISFVGELRGAGGLGAVTESTLPCGSSSVKTFSFYFADSTGAEHPFSGTVKVGPTSCGGDSGQITSTSTDGSGYTLVASGGTASYTVNAWDKYGNAVTSNPGVLIMDSDGNDITISDTNSCQAFGNQCTYTDTLGQQALYKTSTILNQSGSEFDDTYQYTDVSNNNQTYTVEYNPLEVVQLNNGTQWQGSLPTGIVTPEGTYTLSYEIPSGYGSGYTTGRITQIVFPSGGYESFTYAGGTNGINMNSFVVPILTHTISDNNGHVNSWTYVNNNNCSACTIYGGTNNFTVVETDPGNNQTIHFFSSEVQTQISTYQGGCPTATNGCNGGGMLLSTVTICYNGNFTNCSAPSSGPTLPITQIDKYSSNNGGSNNLVEAKFDGYANTTEVKQYDFGAAIPPTGNPISDTVTFYGQSWNGTACTAYPSGTYIYSTPCYSHTMNSSGTDIARTQVTYSNTGHATSVTKWTGGTSFLTTTVTYNTNGTLATVTDTNGAVSTYTYNGTGGCNSLLPTSVTVKGSGLPSAGLTTSTQWNCNGGVPTQSADMSGQITQYGYVNQSGTPDPFWRLLSVTDPLSNVTWTTYSSAGTLPQTVETYLNFPATSPTSTVDTLYTLDGLGRVIESEKRTAPGATTFDNVITYGYSWNSSGPVTTQTIPGGTAVTTTQMDAMGRVISVTDGGGGTVTSTYSQNDVLNALGPAPTNEHLKQVQNQYDGLGRMQDSCIIGNGSTTACGQSTGSLNGVTTAYSYTYASGSSTTTTTRGVQTRTTTYDAMGRITQVSIPETGGTARTYYYDSYTSCPAGYRGINGQLAAVKDPNGNLLCYAYDALNRVTGVNANGTTCRHFYYDNSAGYGGSIPSGVSTPTYSSGRMVEAATDSCSSGTLITDEWFSYDQDGRLQDMWEMTPHSGQYYHSKASFLGNDTINCVNTLQLLSPSLYTMTYTLDGEARLNTLTDTTASQNIVTGVAYNSGSQPTKVSLTGTTPDQSDYTYDSNTGRMKTFEFEVGNTPENLTGTLTWNTNGTLGELQIVDGFNSGGALTCYSNSSSALGYGYDDWARLAAFDCGSSNWGQQYSYDEYDNLTQTVISGRTGTTWNPGYSSVNNHCTGCTYDANGDVTGDGNNVYGWNEFSKMKWTATSGTPTCGTSGRCATYDAFGQIVEQSNGTAWKEHWITQLGDSVNMSGAIPNFGFWPSVAGGSVVINGTTGFGYKHPDWLANARIVSSVTNHNVTRDQAYTPYGEQIDNFGSAGSQYDQFAGLTDNFDFGVMWDTPNRELSTVGRWLSPDPARTGWNQYAYTTNPNSFVDPSGLLVVPVSLPTFNYFSFNSCDHETISILKVDPMCGYDMADDSSSFSFGFSANFCDSDFMPCGQALPNLMQSIWSDVLGLPSGLNCPQVGGISNYLCGGVSPLMDVASTQAPCLAGAGPLLAGQSRCACLTSADNNFQNTFNAVANNFGPKSGAAAFKAAKWGLVAGCITTWEIGCVEGASGGWIIGLLSGGGKSMWDDLYSVGGAYLQKRNEMAACETGP